MRNYCYILCLWSCLIAAAPITAKTPISLNFQSISIRAALHVLADFAHVNLLISDAVTGKITLRLHHVPWHDALAIILKTQGLTQEFLSGVLLIDKANPDKPVVEVALLQLNYAKATDLSTLLKDKSSELLSKYGAVSADSRTNILWLQEVPTRLSMLKQWVHKIDVPNQQVVIEARLVNMSKNCSQDLGVRLGIAKVNHNIPLPDNINIDLAALPLDAPPVTVGIALAKLGNLALLDMELSALESAGKAEVIASPRLMTTNQHAAMIESGEDIPYQETNLNGATSVAFKKAVLRLKVTPQITPEGKFLMSLVLNQDSDSGRRVQGVPILLTKTLETNVLINNGQTIVLGGIYKQEQTKEVVRVPWLGSLPGIGYLFSRHQMRKHKEELLIFITPKLVNN